jgi:branched-chain amino acid transport system substrate-binding protein
MGKKGFFMVVVIFMAALFAMPCPQANAADPIVLGLPLSLNYHYGWVAEKGITLAVEEINAKGGVNVGGVKRPFAIEVMETRDLEPGVPASEALLAVEKLILEKKADFIMGGPVRSEAGMATQDLIAKYKKVSILTTGVLTPNRRGSMDGDWRDYSMPDAARKKIRP